MNTPAFKITGTNVNPDVLFHTQSIEITKTHIFVQSSPSHRTAYAIQQVSSVSIRKEDANLALPAILILGGLALGIGGLTSVNQTNAIAVLVIGFLLIAGGVWAWYVAKPTFSVVIGMSSGERVTLAAENEAAAEGLGAAALQAIATN